MSSIRGLSELKSPEDLSKIISRSSSPILSDASSISAVWGTLSLVQSLTTFSELGVLSTSLALVVPSNISPSGSDPSPEAQNFLKDLARASQMTGMSLACSSVLAGMSSESDEFGDVVLWIGDVLLGEAKEEQVIRLLGLDHLLQKGGMIIPTETSSRAIPSGLVHLPHQGNDPGRSDLDALTSLISRLKQRFEFRLEGVGQGGCVIWFLVGRLEGDQAWAGLIGAGVWKDE